MAAPPEPQPELELRRIVRNAIDNARLGNRYWLVALMNSFFRTDLGHMEADLERWWRPWYGILGHRRCLEIGREVCLARVFKLGEALRHLEVARLELTREYQLDPLASWDEVQAAMHDWAQGANKAASLK